MTKRPLMTILIPCYNGKEYLSQALHSIINQQLIQRKLVDIYEVIIIDDGSLDQSLSLAKKLAKDYNEQIRDQFVTVYTQKNGQYGSVINHGLKVAKGIYFKVLDVDDTFSTKDFISLLYTLAGLKSQVDVIVTNHTFEKVGVNKTYLKSFRQWIEPNQIIDTRQIALPPDLITMHSLIYRLDFLHDINYSQIEKVYYSDSQYAIVPLLQVKSFYYVQLPLYRYYVGRNDQSINIKMMIKNGNHQLKVLKKVWQEVNLDTIYSRKMILYAIIALRRLAQWRMMIIAKDPKVLHKHKAIIETMELLETYQPKYSKLILRGLFFTILKMTRGYMIPTIIRLGAKVYSRFRTNIMAEWG